MIDEEAIGERYRALAGELDERRGRLWAAAEARSHGHGGLAAVVRATGMAENTVRAGLRELEAGHTLEPGRVRRRGGGRKPLSETDPTLVRDLERLVDPDSRGDPGRRRRPRAPGSARGRGRGCAPRPATPGGRPPRSAGAPRIRPATSSFAT